MNIFCASFGLVGHVIIMQITLAVYGNFSAPRAPINTLSNGAIFVDPLISDSESRWTPHSADPDLWLNCVILDTCDGMICNLELTGNFSMEPQSADFFRFSKFFIFILISI